MRHPSVRHVAVAVTTLVVLAVGPVAGASASSKSIEHAIVSYGARIEAAESHVEAAVKEYEQSQDPTGVETAIGESAAVLGALEHKVSRQSAAAPRVKRAKSKIVGGLRTIIAGYEVLSSAYAEKAANPEATKTDAAKAVATVNKGHKQLEEGVKLLG